jgi:putative flippase GtrA
MWQVIAMIICIMGGMEILAVSLGPIEALSLSVVIGVSVDYLVHFAFAYTNSIMKERYFRSRAAFLARCTSIVSASITTLCAVVPLLAAKMHPLRQVSHTAREAGHTECSQNRRAIMRAASLWGRAALLRHASFCVRHSLVLSSRWWPCSRSSSPSASSPRSL